MVLNNLVVPFLFLSAGVASAGEIEATGGGIVAEGADLVLSYKVGKAWEECDWYLYEVGQETPGHCAFDWNSAENKGEMDKCNPTNLTSILNFTPDQDANECSITISSVSDIFNCSWAVRVDAEMNPTNIDVVVAKQVAQATILVGEEEGEGSLRADQDGSVSCTLSGGRPAPSVGLSIADFDKDRLINSSQVQTPDEEGIFTTVETMFLKPKIEDHGKEISCTAAQLDGKSQPLFDVLEAEKITLVVTFPPVSMANQSVKLEEGNSANISFVFQANPAPTTIQWVVTPAPPKNETDEEEDEVTLSPGHDDDKYSASDLIDEGDLKYRLNLTILDVNLEDGDKSYRLEVTNSINTTTYYFELKVLKEGESGDEGGIGTESGLVFTILAVICIVAIILGSIFIYMKKRAKVDSAPLSSMEGRNN